ncbi:MAG: AAA family ATPase [Pseudomonadota bacterium]
MKKPVRSYSKGMTQKLGLAACFLARKDLYVLDEPMSGLDPKARALLKAQLQQLRSRSGTLFFSSHALADVDEICDRMAILHDGQLRFVGSPAECRTRYQAATLEQAYMKCISATGIGHDSSS